MESIVNYMTNEHRRCDNLYARLEDAVMEKDSEKSKEYFKGFSQEMERHLKKEEEILFPAFETATGSEMGPTHVMRMEHTQIREMFRQIENQLNEENSKKINGLLETLMILLQQHNMKEEQMLYPMAEKVLADQSEHLLKSMSA